MSAEVTVVYRKRRNVELVMVAFAQILGISAYLLTHMFRDAEVPAEWPWVAGIWVALGLAAHLVVRFLMPYADPLILPIVLLLNGLGLAMIHRLDLAVVPAQSDANAQLLWTFVAIVGFAISVVLIRDPRRLDRFPYLMFLAGMALLLLPLVPGLGEEKFGARIWITIGTYSFQPAEVAKIVLAIAFASYLAAHREVLAEAGRRFLGIELPRPRDLFPIGVMWGLSLVVLVAQSDLGTSLLFFGLFVMLLYMATEKPAWPIVGTLLFVGGALAAYQLFGHVRVRVSGWLDPFSNFERNYQIIQGQFGLAWGGLTGRGWGLGTPSLTPVAKSDFIAAAFGEELGVVGLMAIIVLYALLVARGLRTALAASEPFMKLLAAGLAFVVALQVFAIIGGVTRLLPLTGLTTPFMSQGGSSLLANWVVVALMLMISHHARKPATAPAADAGEVVSLASDATQQIKIVPRSESTPPDPADSQETTYIGDDGAATQYIGDGAPTQYIATSEPAQPAAETTAIRRPMASPPAGPATPIRKDEDDDTRPVTRPGGER